MTSAILVLNAGSSSNKCKLFTVECLEQEPLWEGNLDWSLKDDQIVMSSRNGKETPKEELLSADTHDPLKKLIGTINFPYALKAIGHRVVHGGMAFRSPVLITPEVKNIIKSLIPLAPLHNPANLSGIEEMERLFPELPQFAVFDTAFHATIPSFAAEYPIPKHWTNLGIRKYGFHGISHSYCAHRAAQMLNKNIADLNMITCHLGNGGSVTAIKEGESVDTSMGFTPLEGIMMGTRSGSIDPGIILFLLREKFSPDEIERALNRDSGLKAISDADGDMRHIIRGISLEEPDSALAMEMYVYRLCKEIGAMATVLGRTDLIVFTAGIGENSPLVREEVCNRLMHLGFNIDVEKNQKCTQDEDLAGEGSSVRILVIHTKEEWAIAEACLHLLGQSDF